jgi:pimeloyl-ACP methyl ester carboxylesterase
MSEGKILPINGTKLHYNEYGKGGQTVIFVHAGIADSRMWDDQVEEFSKTYRVITYDMRGFGSFALAAGEYSHHEDLIVLMDALKVERCVLVGCSKGGGVAIDTALSVPDRVAGLVVVAGIAHGLELKVDFEEPKLWEEYVKVYKQGDLEKRNELEIQMFVDGFNQPPGRAPEAVREKVRQMNALALEHEASSPETTQTVLEPKAAARLGELSMPVLFITAALDEPVTWLAVEQMLPEIPHAERMIMENVAHLPNMEAPKEFNAIVLDFIKGLELG